MSLHRNSMRGRGCRWCQRPSPTQTFLVTAIVHLLRSSFWGLGAAHRQERNGLRVAEKFCKVPSANIVQQSCFKLLVCFMCGLPDVYIPWRFFGLFFQSCRAAVSKSAWSDEGSSPCAHFMMRWPFSPSPCPQDGHASHGKSSSAVFVKVTKFGNVVLRNLLALTWEAAVRASRSSR